MNCNILTTLGYSNLILSLGLSKVFVTPNKMSPCLLHGERSEGTEEECGTEGSWDWLCLPHLPHLTLTGLSSLLKIILVQP